MRVAAISFWRLAIFSSGVYDLRLGLSSPLSLSLAGASAFGLSSGFFGAVFFAAVVMTVSLLTGSWMDYESTLAQRSASHHVADAALRMGGAIGEDRSPPS